MTQGGGRETRTIGGRGGKGLCGNCVTIVLCYSDRHHDAVDKGAKEYPLPPLQFLADCANIFNGLLDVRMAVFI